MEPEIKPTGTNVVPNRADFLGVGWIQRSPPCQSGMAERQRNGASAGIWATGRIAVHATRVASRDIGGACLDL